LHQEESVWSHCPLQFRPLNLLHCQHVRVLGRGYLGLLGVAKIAPHAHVREAAPLTALGRMGSLLEILPGALGPGNLCSPKVAACVVSVALVLVLVAQVTAASASENKCRRPEGAARECRSQN